MFLFSANKICCFFYKCFFFFCGLKFISNTMADLMADAPLIFLTFFFRFATERSHLPKLFLQSNQDEMKLSYKLHNLSNRKSMHHKMSSRRCHKRKLHHDELFEVVHRCHLYKCLISFATSANLRFNNVFFVFKSFHTFLMISCV
jgi:hypothetical protein